MRDRDTGRSRGFGFVTYGTSQEADAAISAMNEADLDGRRIKVNVANARGCKFGFQEFRMSTYAAYSRRRRGWRWL
jgi:RNA recognition motif-containing protein